MVSRLVLIVGLGMLTTVTVVTIVILSVRLADTTTGAGANARTHTRLKETAAGYGIKCNLNRQAITSGRNESTDPCTEFEHLSCNRDRNTCDCVEGRVHDILSGGCKLKVGQPCQVSRDKDGDEDQICVRLAKCRNGHCNCNRTLGLRNDTLGEVSPNGTCVANYQETCFLDEDCAPGTGLVCRDGVCDCRKSGWFSLVDDHYFSRGTNQCVTKVGGKCDPSRTPTQGSSDVGCSPNAQCDPGTGKCVCEPGFTTQWLRSVRRQEMGPDCVRGSDPISTYGASCVNTNPGVTGPLNRNPSPPNLKCDSSKGFACLNGVCTCDNPKAVYRQTAGKCLVPSVHLGGECVLNADCEPGLGFVCMSGMCSCRSPTEQFYSHEQSRCVARVGAGCVANTIISVSGTTSPGFRVGAGVLVVCAPNSTCNATGKDGAGACTCDPGFVPSPDRDRCIRVITTYGTTCVNEDPTTAGSPNYFHGALHLRCDHSKGMACVNGSCECAEPRAKYGGLERGCIAPVGAQCGRVQLMNCRPTYGTRCEYYKLSCVDGSVCKKEEEDYEPAPGNPVWVPRSFCVPAV